jgi:hypothetical protein
MHSPTCSALRNFCIAGIRGSAGRIGGRDEYRQIVLQVLNAAYVFQFRFDGQRLVILRIFHGREERY